MADQARLPSLIAAHQTADAVSALLLHHDEGHFGDIEVVEKLAEALVISIGLRLDEIESCDTALREALAELRDVAARYLEQWAG